jgi:hypothetical protein
MLIDHLKTIAALPGVHGVYLVTPTETAVEISSERTSKPDETMARVLEQALVIARTQAPCDKPYRRAIVAGLNIETAKYGDQEVAVAYEVAHETGKSLRRMVKRMAKEKPNVRAGKLRPVHSTEDVDPVNSRPF